jgi:hypothetical protein
MKKPEVFEYVDSQMIDGKEIHCKFDVDYGYPETRWEPGDPGGLCITEAIYEGKDILDELSEKEVEIITTNAENVFWVDLAASQIDYGDYAADIARDEELMEKYK